MNKSTVEWTARKKIESELIFDNTHLIRYFLFSFFSVSVVCFAPCYPFLD